MPHDSTSTDHQAAEESLAAVGRELAAGRGLAADLEGCIDQYPDGRIPSTHLRLILTRYRSRCADPRPAAAAHPEREGR